MVEKQMDFSSNNNVSSFPFFSFINKIKKSKTAEEFNWSSKGWNNRCIGPYKLMGICGNCLLNFGNEKSLFHYSKIYLIKNMNTGNVFKIPGCRYFAKIFESGTNKVLDSFYVGWDFIIGNKEKDL